MANYRRYPPRSDTGTVLIVCLILLLCSIAGATWLWHHL